MFLNQTSSSSTTKNGWGCERALSNSHLLKKSGIGRGVCPKTKKQVLDVTKLDGKNHLVNKTAQIHQDGVLPVENVQNFCALSAMSNCIRIRV